ncbi:DUF58 domain-containing protein [Vibrio agarivorans]|uniref:DUF58 domain-containing protein n=1 Tax=Vibrio agarivorans TaxID=153622 RepID=A0ABT7XZH4_9VIBR|nr:DUF58 domain-containing protein [Vibrio agarivorans]MDN2481183.1 DUF58 domain-containing protein [Vibrio agarivorans]
MPMDTADYRVYSDLPNLLKTEFISHQLVLPPSGKFGSRLVGRHFSSFRGRGLSFEEFRHYQAGDDTRNIDWAVTMRTGEPYVRVLSEEKDRPVYLVVDQRSNMFFSSVETMKSVVCAEVAATCAFSCIKSGDRLAAVLIGDDCCELFPPRRSRDHIYKILGKIAQLNQSLSSENTQQATSERQLDSALQNIAISKPKGALVIVLTDFYQLNQSTLKQLQWLKRHNDVLGIAIRDPLEVELSPSDSFLMSDGKHQVLIGDEYAKQLTHFNFEHHQQFRRLRALLAANGFPMIELSTCGNHQNELVKQMMGGRRV